MKQFFVMCGCAIVGLFVCGSTTGLASISISGLGEWGSFSGSLDYSYASSNQAQLVVSLTNTSSLDNGGYLTAFVFNNPSGAIVNGSLGSSQNGFVLMGSPFFYNTVNGAPFGVFDIGAGVGGDFQGGGNPSPGLAAGSTGEFIFVFEGTGLDMLTEQSFLGEMSAPPGDGEGLHSFAVRFRGFENDKSDKIPGQVVPEPATVLLLGSGLFGLLGLRKRG